MQGNHFFNVEFACRYGVFEAVVFQNLHFWCQHNKANNKNFYDGSFWTFNSCEAFSRIFPYMSKDKVSRTLKKLEDNNLIKSGCYNKMKYDRTKWYAITDFGIAELKECSEIAIDNTNIPFENSENFSNAINKNADSILQNCEMEKVNLQDEFCNSAEPIPYINTDIKKIKTERYKEPLSQNQNQQIQQEFSATEIPLNYDVKKIYEQWCYYKLPSKNFFEFSTRFKDGIQYLRKNFISETNEILTAIQNYAEEKENSDFLKNLNWNFTAFTNKIEKFIPEYYKKGCYGTLDKQKEKIDYSDPYWQEKETARKQEERKRQDEEIRKNGYVLPTLKNGKTIYRNELNQPLDEWGKIDIQELSNELKAEEKYMPEKFNEKQIVMLGLVTYNGFCVPQELMTVKL